MQEGARVLAGSVADRRWDFRELIVEVGLGQFVGAADGEISAQQLVRVNAQGTLPVPQLFRCAGWKRICADDIVNAHERVGLGFQHFPGHPEIGLRRQFSVDRHAPGFKSRAGDIAGHRFRDDAAKGLVEAGELRGFEPHAVIVKDAAERARENGAHRGICHRLPHQSGLGRYLVFGRLLAGDRWQIDVARIIQPIIAEARGQLERADDLPVAVTVNSHALQVRDHLLRVRRERRRYHILA